jgi:hypothetical protein
MFTKDGDNGSKTRAAVILYWKQLDRMPNIGWGVGVNNENCLLIEG